MKTRVKLHEGIKSRTVPKHLNILLHMIGHDDILHFQAVSIEDQNFVLHGKNNLLAQGAEHPMLTLCIDGIVRLVQFLSCVVVEFYHFVM